MSFSSQLTRSRADVKHQYRFHAQMSNLVLGGAVRLSYRRKKHRYTVKSRVKQIDSIGWCPLSYQYAQSKECDRAALNVSVLLLVFRLMNHLSCYVRMKFFDVPHVRCC